MGNMPSHDTQSITLPLQPLPEGTMQAESVAIIKAMDSNGDMHIYFRHSDGMNDWEAIGMMTAAIDLARGRIYDAFTPDEDDE